MSDSSQISIPPKVRFVMLAEWVFRHWLHIWVVLFSLYNLLPILAPILMQLGLMYLATPLYNLYNLVGHQLANRSFFFFGEQTTYTVQELPVSLVGEFIADSTALGDFIGNSDFGWKMAWSDRLVSMYGSALITTYAYILLRNRPNFRGLSRTWMLILTVPLILDGATHWVSDFGSLTDGFRWDNAWLTVLTANSFPSAFYIGDEWGSFNSLMRLITGILFGIGLMAWALPICERYFARNADILQGRLANWWARQTTETNT